MNRRTLALTGLFTALLPAITRADAVTATFDKSQQAGAKTYAVQSAPSSTVKKLVALMSGSRALSLGLGAFSGVTTAGDAGVLLTGGTSVTAQVTAQDSAADFDLSTFSCSIVGIPPAPPQISIAIDTPNDCTSSNTCRAFVANVVPGSDCNGAFMWSSSDQTDNGTNNYTGMASSRLCVKPSDGRQSGSSPATVNGVGVWCQDNGAGGVTTGTFEPTNINT